VPARCPDCGAARPEAPGTAAACLACQASVGGPRRAPTEEQPAPTAWAWAAPAAVQALRSRQLGLILRASFASAMLAAGDRDRAETVLLAATDAAGHWRLPHQIQRVVRITREHGHRDLHQHARAVLVRAYSRPGPGSKRPS
jgi:hypothetical protein